ncbi:MAG: tRNA lysidine(34) synthetase TilS [Ruminococcaceae bacterium]|nr:tRNA lysidine(34) synthetase TilS [Oscillospiraceae bacterium]
MENTKRKFFAAVEEFSPDSGVVVALSGGADSVCLLDLFLECGFAHPVAAAHFNHNLRGEEAKRDEDFCIELCKKRGVKLFLGSADVNALAKINGKGVEEAAREARYAFLESVIESNTGFSYIATAHNRGDMCETMLLNLARGTSLDGMCAIPKRRGNIIRPILDVSREEILAYNKSRSLEFITDSTNLDDKYSRNRVRLNIMPEIKQLYSGYEENFARAARLFRRDSDYIAGEVEKKYTEVVKDGVMYTENAQNIHLSILSRIVKKLYNYHGFKDLTEAHIDAICEKIISGDKNFELSLHSSYALCERGKLTFIKTLPEADEFCIDINIGESVTLPGGITVTLSKEKKEGAYPLKESALCGRLTLRSRREGDTVTVFGKTHKIKRMIADKKLSVNEKSKLFFLTSDGEIIYSNIPATADKAFCRRGDICIYITVKEERHEQ